MAYKYKVQSVTHEENGRRARIVPHNPTQDRGYSWGSIDLNVPVETPCDPGDIVTIEIQWGGGE